MSSSAIAAVWSESWAHLASEIPDLEVRLPTVERQPGVARAMAAAGREAGRCQRGAGDLAELERRLRAWENAVLQAMVAQDHARSERLCADCGAEDTPTISPGLTSGRICHACAREPRS